MSVDAATTEWQSYCTFLNNLVPLCTTLEDQITGLDKTLTDLSQELQVFYAGKGKDDEISKSDEVRKKVVSKMAEALRACSGPKAELISVLEQCRREAKCLSGSMASIGDTLTEREKAVGAKNHYDEKLKKLRAESLKMRHLGKTETTRSYERLLRNERKGKAAAVEWERKDTAARELLGTAIRSKYRKTAPIVVHLVDGVHSFVTKYALHMRPLPVCTAGLCKQAGVPVPEGHLGAEEAEASEGRLLSRRLSRQYSLGMGGGGGGGLSRRRSFNGRGDVTATAAGFGDTLGGLSEKGGVEVDGSGRRAGGGASSRRGSAVSPAGTVATQNGGRSRPPKHKGGRGAGQQAQSEEGGGDLDESEWPEGFSPEEAFGSDVADRLSALLDGIDCPGYGQGPKCRGERTRRRAGSLNAPPTSASVPAFPMSLSRQNSDDSESTLTGLQQAMGGNSMGTAPLTTRSDSRVLSPTGSSSSSATGNTTAKPPAYPGKRPPAGPHTAATTAGVMTINPQLQQYHQQQQQILMQTTPGHGHPPPSPTLTAETSIDPLYTAGGGHGVDPRVGTAPGAETGPAVTASSAVMQQQQQQHYPPSANSVSTPASLFRMSLQPGSGEAGLQALHFMYPPEADIPPRAPQQQQQHQANPAGVSSPPLGMDRDEDRIRAQVQQMDTSGWTWHSSSSSATSHQVPLLLQPQQQQQRPSTLPHDLPVSPLPDLMNLSGSPTEAAARRQQIQKENSEVTQAAAGESAQKAEVPQAPVESSNPPTAPKEGKQTSLEVPSAVALPVSPSAASTGTGAATEAEKASSEQSADPEVLSQTAAQQHLAWQQQQQQQHYMLLQLQQFQQAQMQQQWQQFQAAQQHAGMDPSVLHLHHQMLIQQQQQHHLLQYQQQQQLAAEGAFSHPPQSISSPPQQVAPQPEQPDSSPLPPHPTVTPQPPTPSASSEHQQSTLSPKASTPMSPHVQAGQKSQLEKDKPAERPLPPPAATLPQAPATPPVPPRVPSLATASLPMPAAGPATSAPVPLSARSRSNTRKNSAGAPGGSAMEIAMQKAQQVLQRVHSGPSVTSSMPLLPPSQTQQPHHHQTPLAAATTRRTIPKSAMKTDGTVRAGDAAHVQIEAEGGGSPYGDLFGSRRVGGDSAVPRTVSVPAGGGPPPASSPCGSAASAFVQQPGGHMQMSLSPAASAASSPVPENLQAVRSAPLQAAPPLSRTPEVAGVSVGGSLGQVKENGGVGEAHHRQNVVPPRRV